MTFTVAGGIVRNRDWVIDDHVEALRKNRVDALFYVEGDSFDHTKEALERNKVEFVTVNTGYSGWRRGTYHSSNMGMLRNLWIYHALEFYPEATHLWSVDSDVIVPENALSNLLSHNKDIIAAYVPVSNGKMPIHMFGWSDADNHPIRTGEEKHISSIPRRCTLVGACVLMKRDTIEPIMPVYGEDGQGEDGFFAKKMRSSGVEQWVDPVVICEHRMNEPEEWKLKWGVQ